jgi:GT2 family glycosyltransferase
MSPRPVYDEVGGLSLRFPNAYNDVDYCLKVIDAGYRVTYSPGARMFHHESSSREAAVQGWERELLEARWARWADGDPYYNPNFCQDSLDYVVPPYLADGTLMKR